LKVTTDNELFKNVCRIHLLHAIYRYLIVNAEGRWDGAEKSQRHREMCQFYVAAYRGLTDADDVQMETEDSGYWLVHEKTQQLTDHLDEVIGFPLKGKHDYELLETLFFDRFHELAMSAFMDHTDHPDHSEDKIDINQCTC
jgi:hypothetical protein